MLPGAAPVAAVVGGVVKGIGAFVKYLVSYAAKGDDVPGLKAMVPGGAFVEEINKTQQGQPGPGTNWYVVSSNFHVKLFDDSHNPPEFPRELVVKLGRGIRGQALRRAPTTSSSTSPRWTASTRRWAGSSATALALGENDTVYHTNYFSQLRVIEALAGWLPLGLGAGGEAMRRDRRRQPGHRPRHAARAAERRAARQARGPNRRPLRRCPEPPASAPMPQPPATPRSAPPRQPSRTCPPRMPS